MGDPFLEMENHVIGRLKQECGESFTKKLEQMQKDLKANEEILPEFKRTVDTQDIEMIPVILNKAIWPEQSSEGMIVPDQLIFSLNALKNWYSALFKHRVVEIDWNSSTMVLQMNLNGEKQSVEGDAVACSVLLLFNTHKCQEEKELQERMGLDKNMIEAALHGLTKSKLLLSDGAQIHFNQNQQGKRNIQIKKYWVMDEKDLTNIKQTGLVEKSSYLEANIMKIVKERKKIQRGILAQELFKQTKLNLSKEDFTKKLEALSERE